MPVLPNTEHLVISMIVMVKMILISEIKQDFYNLAILFSAKR